MAGVTESQIDLTKLKQGKKGPNSLIACTVLYTRITLHTHNLRLCSFISFAFFPFHLSTLSQTALLSSCYLLSFSIPATHHTGFHRLNHPH